MNSMPFRCATKANPQMAEASNNSRSDLTVRDLIVDNHTSKLVFQEVDETCIKVFQSRLRF